MLACITQVKAKNGIIERENYEDTRISNNLNQYARKANETGKLYEEDIAEIKKMNNEQTELLKKALEAVIHLYEDDSKKRK
ncbi:plasmid mobilization relaxosome protein MobC [Eshraghiella crossota]|uniref:plasmid mobilization relaxosome protein MobC n=1 Tax=Eshraghiella crossota TaxID=45851 RepID=UPI001F625024|nr:plasmid mobilization relaxosome protein MobC [Butyrivibrio crossotus]